MMEPRAATPERRLDALQLLSKAGIPTGVMVAPVVPAINDEEIEAILKRGYRAGALQAGYILLRLPLEIKDLFQEWLQVNFPDRAGHVMTLMRQMRGGKDYDAAWGRRMRGAGPYAEMIARRFRITCSRLGLNRADLTLDTSRFTRPFDRHGQMGLF